MSNSGTDESKRGDEVAQPAEEKPKMIVPVGYENLGPLEPLLCVGGKVSKGFQRGSKLLGIPTANIPVEDEENPEQQVLVEKLEAGIYFGWAQLYKEKVPSADEIDEEDEDNFEGLVLKTVVSVGWNPYFKNEKKTVEPHIIHTFEQDFYDYYIRVVLCGYLRPELDFTSMDALIDAIKKDIELSTKLLDEDAYASAKTHEFFPVLKSKDESAA